MLRLGLFGFKASACLGLISVIWAASHQASLPRLYLAAARGDEADVLKQIRSGAPVDCLTVDDWAYDVTHTNMTPLMVASLQGSVRVVEILLENGANVNAMTMEGESALLWACRGRDPRVVEILIQHGATVNPTSIANPPLIEAVKVGNVESARLLLSSGADPNARGLPGGRPAMQYIDIQFGDMHSATMLALLMHYGADVNLADSHGVTPLMMFAPLSAHLTDLLIDAGADVNARCSAAFGTSALHVAARAGAVESLERLLAAGADIEYAGEDQRTALDVAERNRRANAAELLRRARAELQR